jgi:hypothetical protein
MTNYDQKHGFPSKKRGDPQLGRPSMVNLLTLPVYLATAAAAGAAAGLA